MVRALKSFIGLLMVCGGHGAVIGAVWCFSFGLGVALFGQDRAEELTRGLDLSDWESVLFCGVFGIGVGIGSLVWIVLGMVPIWGFLGFQIDDPHGLIKKPLERLYRLWMRAFKEVKIEDGGED